jgi:ribonuclease-3
MVVSLGNSVLEWQRIDVIKHLDIIQRVIDEDLAIIESNKTRTIDKLNRWKRDLEYIEEKIQTAEKSLIPRLERIFSVNLNNNGLLTVSLFQPSTKNLFSEIRIHYCNGKTNRLDCDILLDLAHLGEASEMLALLGDAAIDVAVLHHVWKPKASDAGTLTQSRAQLVSNEHLSEKCDEWGLYVNRIHFDPDTPSKSEMDHDKGTLVEALYGVVYVERGFDKVLELVKCLI